MTKYTITKPEVEPMTDDAPPVWPPVAHLIHKKDEPCKEGTIALCGAKLMGLDLGPINKLSKVCEKCVEVFRKLEMA